MSSVTGGTFPARIWTAFMKAALKGQPVLSFPPPANIGGLEPIVMTSSEEPQAEVSEEPQSIPVE